MMYSVAIVRFLASMHAVSTMRQLRHTRPGVTERIEDFGGAALHN